MKTAKLVIGIVSIVLTFLIMFQSCAASLGDAIIDEGGTSGGAGMLVAILMLIAGIVVLAARASKGGCIFSLVSYALAGILGVTSNGIYKDLIFWGILSFFFAAILLVDIIKEKKNSNPSK